MTYCIPTSKLLIADDRNKKKFYAIQKGAVHAIQKGANAIAAGKCSWLDSSSHHSCMSWCLVPVALLYQSFWCGSCSFEAHGAALCIPFRILTELSP